MAKDAFDLLDHFGWKSDIHLVGVSMGGMISLEMATTEPERLKTLTLTSTCAKKNIPTVSEAYIFFFRNIYQAFLRLSIWTFD
jgi:pimeloyl-ACP methyl ester carboxylesterase